MTDTAIEPVLDEALDFSPLCEYGPISMGFSSCEEVATWIAYSKPICSCRKSEYRFFCDPCLQWRSTLRASTVLVCVTCGTNADASDHPILWAEPIRGGRLND